MKRGQVPGWAQWQINLRDSMHWWIDKSTKSWEHTPWGGGHDEAIFTRTWMTYYLLTGDRTAYDFLDRLAHELIESRMVEACTCFLREEDAAKCPKVKRRPPYHGYPADQACFVHAPENYAWFLTHMAHINPAPEIRRALEDCAEHVGNWSADVPPWYDWEKRRFRSSLLGTKTVRDYPPYDYETLALVRVMVLASNMYYITGEARYLELCRNWADKWAQLVLDSDAKEGFPTILFPCRDDEIESGYGEYAHFRQYRTKLDYELASLLLDLYYYTHEGSYAQAVRKMLNNCAEWNAGSGADPVIIGSLQAKYRSMTGERSFDQRVVALADTMVLDESDNRPALALMNKSSEQFLQVAGLQYVRMFTDGRVALDTRRTSILTAAYVVTHDTSYLEYAMQLAFNRFLDSHYIWDGRELGCRGSWQGRNGVAMLNVIPPMMISATGGYGMLQGERPWYEVRYFQASGEPGLPGRLAALLLPGEPRERTIKLGNLGDEDETVRVKPDNLLAGGGGRPLEFRSATLDGRPIPDPANGVTIAPGQLAELRIELAPAEG